MGLENRNPEQWDDNQEPKDIQGNAISDAGVKGNPSHIENPPYAMTLREALDDEGSTLNPEIDDEDLRKLQAGKFRSERPPARELPVETAKPRFSTRNKVIASFAGAAVLVGGGLFAVKSAGDKNETPTTPEPGNEAPVAPTPEAPAEPTNPGAGEPTVDPAEPTHVPVESFTPTPSESAEPTPEKTEQASKYTYDELNAMEAKEVAELPLDDRLVFTQRMYNYFTEWSLIELGADLYERGKNYDTSDIYLHNPSVIAAPDNTPEQIIKQLIFDHQAMRLMKDDMSMMQGFSIEAASKLMAGIYIEPDFIKNKANDSVADTDMYKNAIDNLKDMEYATAVFPQTIDKIDESVTSVRTITDDNGETRRVAELEYQVTFTESSGKYYEVSEETPVIFKQKAVYHQPKGADTGVWLIFEEWSGAGTIN